MSGRTILFAGGGSGGHISPALAIAEAIETIDNDATLLFACSDRDIDRDMLNESGRAAISLPARPPSLRPNHLLRFFRGFRASRRIVRLLIEQHHIDVTILLGGYVAAPAAAASRSAGVPSMMVNLDRVPGRANRWMRPSASLVVSAVQTVRPFAESVTGMPIRRAAMPPADAAECRRMLGLDSDRPTLIITGASQGAGTINTLMPPLAAAHRDLLAPWQILHLTGSAASARAGEQWKRVGIEATVLGFRHDMGVVWGSGDLVISRAGACSVAEIEYAGLPAIYLPYPHHRDQHQRHNAEPAAAAGAAIIVEDDTDPTATADRLIERARDLLGRSEHLKAMQQAAAVRSGKNAAGDLARRGLSLIGSGGS
ncbi:MAG: UDP-N-acetylglucosamine--N-acetylmuramyl-(pentapeptide) pyrophosphoryl-undecaprenol N-acetylglucosamine transferase [Phycisphaerales bacterium]|nr:UDP-N-acetylglucosamine--N-acetylmuramyl-(pentapeptide) pyrophosphoryl-undecaprenol N-acetylglucosamine transferase [Phycisphaerales bacterium]MDP6889720.1 UDP-N-acetylglucosamine--N-acetylmuramyl-(pentapeptide) pyrophosphoryl-undecaprenol N-acetylglucosamine transferase [Phycisphaerales bacterium]